jgi:UDP-glucose 4-epimerase
MKILVTGGAGFIGSHLCEELVKDTNNSIYSLDNYSTGKKENHIERVAYIQGETKDIDNLIDVNPDVIYHLGEYSRVEQSFDDIEKVWNSNKGGIFAVLQFCRKTKAKLIYAGSSTKFGDGGLGRSQSPYAWTKASNTELVENYGDWFGVKYAITYFYNVYGGREISTGKYATLIALFKEQYKNRHALTVVSPGTQERNFTHISDIISGLIVVGEKGEGDNYGIGCSESFSILEIANMFNTEIKILPERKGNRMSAQVVCDKTKKLGWKETYSIKNYIDEIKENARKD